MTNSITYEAVAGSPSSPEMLSGEVSSTASPTTTTMPMIQPTRKAGPLARVVGETTIKITTMIANGLKPTPIAAARTSPIA